MSHRGRCDTDVEAVRTWQTGISASGTVMYGKQHKYRCARSAAALSSR
ncbi:hypothetical protein ABZX40_07160 [Streptomyces sp. NPDC004610]